MKRTLCFILSIAIAASLVAQEPKKKKPKKLPAPPDIKALLVTGGCCHDYMNQREIIPAAIDAHSKKKVEWTIFHQRTANTISGLDFYKNADWAKGYDVVVHNECFAKVSDEELIANILKAHEGGIPAVLIHCSMHSYRDNPKMGEKWWEFCGLHSAKHGPKHPLDVKITNKGHEAVKGLANWTTPEGELYYIEKTYPTMTPLAESKSEADGRVHVNIWTNAYGKNETRVFGTTIGHHNSTMQDPAYQDMITRGFLWAAGKPVAENIK